MTVVVLTACPPGLRGHLTKWLLEIAPGVFVGQVSPRVRNLLWARVQELAGRGRALLVYSARNEQRLSFKVHDHSWTPDDYDGLTLMRRPCDPELLPPGLTPTQKALLGGVFEQDVRVSGGAVRPGWSKAAKRRRFGR